MADPRESKIIDLVSHAAANPYSFAPQTVAYTPTTIFRFSAGPDHPLHQWDRAVIAEMPGLVDIATGTMIGLTNPWPDAARPFLNFEVGITWYPGIFAAEVEVTLPVQEL